MNVSGFDLGCFCLFYCPCAVRVDWAVTVCILCRLSQLTSSYPEVPAGCQRGGVCGKQSTLLHALSSCSSWFLEDEATFWPDVGRCRPPGSLQTLDREGSCRPQTSLCSGKEWIKTMNNYWTSSELQKIKINRLYDKCMTRRYQGSALVNIQILLP